MKFTSMKRFKVVCIDGTNELYLSLDSDGGKLYKSKVHSGKSFEELKGVCGMFNYMAKNGRLKLKDLIMDNWEKLDENIILHGW